MKLLLGLLLTLSLNAIDHQWVKSNYASLTKAQKASLLKSYQVGNLIVLGGEPQGLNLAAISLAESSCGIFREGDEGTSLGLTHISISRARALNKTLRSIPRSRLRTAIKHNDKLNRALCLANLKHHYHYWGSVTAAVRAHNGYNPRKGFYNTAYAERIANCIAVIKLVLKE